MYLGKYVRMMMMMMMITDNKDDSYYDRQYVDVDHDNDSNKIFR